MSTTFKDKNGREWRLRFGAMTLRNVCAELNLSIEKLTSLGDEKKLQQFPVADLVDILPIVLRKQLIERNMSPEDLLDDDNMGIAELTAAFNSLGPALNEAFAGSQGSELTKGGPGGGKGKKSKKGRGK